MARPRGKTLIGQASPLILAGGPGRTANYSHVRELAWSVFLGQDLGRCYMAMFGAYADTSGKVRTPPFLVSAAVVGSVRHMINLERQWNAVLRKWGLDHIHMTNLMAAKPPFERFRKGDDAASDKLLDQLRRVIQKNTDHVCVVTVDVADYHAVDQVYELSTQVGTELGVACGALFQKVHARHLVVHPNQPIRLYHEAGDTDLESINHFLRVRGGPRVNFEPAVDPQTGKCFVPYQAADVLAWESRRFALTGMDRSRARWAFGDIMNRWGPKGTHFHVDGGVLREYCQTHMVLRRPAKI